ncbi:MAG: helix-turn-helix domain-containing protein [Clostridia bacterium]|nr:helix-turn-helix domain-containing protein [Clostridia bacterium]
MVTDKFHQNLSNLRREKGISQKVAAANLGVSQALLSHYEKGIREPGFDFLIRCAEYYDCSVDYILGRTNDRRGIAYIPEEYDFESGCEYPEIEIRRITGAIKTMSDILVHTENDALLAQMLGYLKLCLYRLVRHLSADKEKQLAHFKLDFSASNALSSAMISIIEEKIRELNLNTNNQLPAGVGTAENVYGWNALTDIITEAEDRADILNRFDFTQE